MVAMPRSAISTRVFQNSKKSWLLLVLFCFIGGWQHAIFALDAGKIVKELEKLLRQEVQKHVSGIVSKEIVRFDRQTGTLSFSPMFLQGVGQLLQHRSGEFKKFNVIPKDNQLGLEVSTVGGTQVTLNLVPQNIQVDLQEMTLHGLIPGGLQMNLPELSKSSISSMFDMVMGVAPQVSKLMQHVSVEGDAFTLRRPIKVTALPRLLDLGKVLGDDAKATYKLPITMQNGWLQLELGAGTYRDQLVNAGIELILLRVKDVVADKIQGLGKGSEP